MSKKPSKYSSLLNGNQAPKSPAELDRKILQYAEVHKQATRTRAPWAPILITISVIGIAVLITVQPPKMGEFDREAIREFDNFPIGIEETAESPAKKSATTNERFLDKHSGVGGLRMKAAAEDEASSYQPEKAPASVSAVLDAPSKSETRKTTLSITARKKDDLQETLKNLNELLVNGNSEKAYSEYHRLRKICLGCELPDTLEMAVEQMFE